MSAPAEPGRRRAFVVEVNVGTLHLEVEAFDTEDAIGAALNQWIADADKIIGAGTFTVREADRG